MPEATLCIFAKAPRPGRVKTRLAAATGKGGAAALARAFLIDTCAGAREHTGARAVVAAAGALDADLQERLGLEVWDQGTGDLGARIERVLTRALATSPVAIAVGADTPGLPPALLRSARAALAGADAVIGPSSDGGFYLLGLRRYPAGTLDGVTWSAPTTFTETLQRLRDRGLAAVVIEPWFDVDAPADLSRLRGLLASGAIQAAETARLLRRPVISVIMPTIDEEHRLPGALAQVNRLTGIDEVIVVDGGSRDRSPALARAAGARVLVAPRGRALQMNAGAAGARGDTLLFLHADTSLPDDAADHIANALIDPDTVAGAFRTWTVADPPRPWFAPLMHLADLRSRYSGLPYGDQAMFVRARRFAELGGFPALPLMEDLELSRRLRRSGRIHVVDARVQTSGRRFAARPVYYTVMVNLLPVLHRLGVSAAALRRLYGDVR